MTCYKCHTEKDLSLKRRLKSGHELFICRPCRREAAKGYTPPYRWDKQDEWNFLAYKRVRELTEKYSSLKSEISSSLSLHQV